MDAIEAWYAAGCGSETGDVFLHTGDLFVGFSHRAPRDSYGDFLARGEPRGRPTWFKWEELLDLPRVVEQVRSIDGPPAPAPTAEEEVDPFT